MSFSGLTTDTGVRDMHPFPPDPFGENDDGIKIFDPGLPRFSDVPLVRFSRRGALVVRGALPDTLSPSRLRQAAADIDALPGEVFGVLTNALGDLVLAEDGVDFGYDVRFEREITIDLQVLETTDAAALLRDLNAITAGTAQGGRELVRTLQAGWQVFHVECGMTTRISCYDPTYSHRVASRTKKVCPA